MRDVPVTSNRIGIAISCESFILEPSSLRNQREQYTEVRTRNGSDGTGTHASGVLTSRRVTSRVNSTTATLEPASAGGIKLSHPLTRMGLTPVLQLLD